MFVCRYYHATLSIGNPPKSYFLDIDTGSDLTWLQCDAPCTKCTPVSNSSLNKMIKKKKLCFSVLIFGCWLCRHLTSLISLTRNSWNVWIHFANLFIGRKHTNVNLLKSSVTTPFNMRMMDRLLVCWLKTPFPYNTSMEP